MFLPNFHLLFYVKLGSDKSFLWHNYFCYSMKCLLMLGAYGEGGKNIAMLQLKTLIKNEIELPLECTKFLVSNNVAWEGNRYRIEH